MPGSDQECRLPDYRNDPNVGTSALDGIEEVLVTGECLRTSDEMIGFPDLICGI